MKEYMRLESDSIGTMEVPEDAYYGVQALRAKENFPITGTRLHPVFIKNLAKIKRAAAITNRKAGRLKPEIANAIESACNEVVCGMFDKEFIVDGIQGGAGTSANMNMNEVIANRAIEMLCGKKGDYTIVHPNDHINMAQSTNDVIPTAGKLTVLDLLKPLDKSLSLLTDALYDKAAAFDHIVKIGRTQLEDAVPMRLGQTFHSYATMISRDRDRLTKVRTEMYPVNMGATAIGTAINTSPFYLDNIVPTLGKITGYPLTQADDLFDATENLDGFVRVSRDKKSRTFSSNSKKKSHFADFLTEQTLDFVLHRFFCSLAEMHTDDIGCLADLLSDSRARGVGGGAVGCGIVHSKSSCK